MFEKEYVVLKGLLGVSENTIKFEAYKYERSFPSGIVSYFVRAGIYYIIFCFDKGKLRHVIYNAGSEVNLPMGSAMILIDNKKITHIPPKDLINYFESLLK